MAFTTKIDLSFKEKLESDLRAQGFIFSHPPYTIFSAKKKGVSCTLYESGTLMVQGKEMKEFMEFYIEPEILGSFPFTNPELHTNMEPHIGMDEAGKGDFFGPLCISALFADQEGIRKLLEIGVKDSKRFNDKAIEKMAQKIRKEFPFTTIRLFPKKYNELHAKFKNLNRLLAWAHTAALADLSLKTGCKTAILDQFADKSVMESALKQKKLLVNLEQKVRAEEDPVVAAASILARSAFVQGMDMLSEEVGMTLPKGAGPLVIEVGRSLVEKKGESVLETVAKTHFKTIKNLS